MTNGVIVADNVISGNAFAAIRLNATNDTPVSGNYCLSSGEVAIFSEFGFDSDGRLATCTGNIVRNMRDQRQRSARLPDRHRRQRRRGCGKGSGQQQPGRRGQFGRGRGARFDMISDDLQRDAHRFPTVSMSENSVD
jgi:putative cofactor-binding repeat protein